MRWQQWPTQPELAHGGDINRRVDWRRSDQSSARRSGSGDADSPSCTRHPPTRLCAPTSRHNPRLVTLNTNATDPVAARPSQAQDPAETMREASGTNTSENAAASRWLGPSVRSKTSSAAFHPTPYSRGSHQRSKTALSLADRIFEEITDRIDYRRLWSSRASLWSDLPMAATVPLRAASRDAADDRARRHRCPVSAGTQTSGAASPPCRSVRIRA